MPVRKEDQIEILENMNQINYLSTIHKDTPCVVLLCLINRKGQIA
jgi:hypothetical protein